MYPEEEVPMFRTCLGAPISAGLFIWAMLRMLLDMVAVVCGGSPVFFILIFGFKELITEPSIYHLLLLGYIVVVLDIPFLITLMIGICQHSYSILKALYYYVICIVILEVLTVPVFIFALYLNKAQLINYIYFVVIAIIVLTVDTTVILAMKSKLVLMRNKNLPEFLKMTEKE